MSFDPIACQGLFNAIPAGMAATKTVLGTDIHGGVFIAYINEPESVARTLLHAATGFTKRNIAGPTEVSGEGSWLSPFER